MKTLKVGTIVAVDTVTGRWEIPAWKGTEDVDDLMEDLRSLSEEMKDFLPDHHIFVLTAEVPLEFPEIRAKVEAQTVAHTTARL